MDGVLFVVERYDMVRYDSGLVVLLIDVLLCTTAIKGTASTILEKQFQYGCHSTLFFNCNALDRSAIGTGLLRFVKYRKHHVMSKMQ